MFGIKRQLQIILSRVLDATIIPNNKVNDWPEANYIQRLLRKLDTDCIFDVGGNRGQFAKWIRAGGFAGTILSFEPNPEPYSDLVKAAAADENWRAFPYALGEQEDKLSFNVMALDVFSSFLSPNDDKSLGYSTENRVVTTIEVPVRTLDRIYDELKRQVGFNRPLLKMDTQGYDLKVLAGAKSNISDFCALLSEVAFRRLYEDAPSFAESFAAFRAAGFELSAIFPVHPDKILNLPEMNVYCVRADLLRLEPLGAPAQSRSR